MAVQYLVGTPIVATAVLYVDGTPTDFDSDPTLSVVDPNGTAVTPGAIQHITTGVYRSIIAARSDCTVLYATWSGVVAGNSTTIYTEYEVVASTLFTEAQARTWGVKANSTIIPLSSETEYPDSKVLAERTRIGDDLEQWTGRSWIGRYARVELSGNGANQLGLRDGVCRRSTGALLHRPGRHHDVTKIISCTVDGTAVTVGNIDFKNGVLYRTDSTWSWATSTDPFNVVVEYQYGIVGTVDGSDRIGLDLLIDRMVPSMFPERALTWDMGMGPVRLVTEGGPGMNRTRLPHVNQWIVDHSFQRVLV